MDNLAFSNFVLTLIFFILFLTSAFFCIKYLQLMNKKLDEIYLSVDAEPFLDGFSDTSVEVEKVPVDFNIPSGIGEEDA
jgi:hypothetical protein